MSWKATAYVKDLRQAPNGQRLTRSEKLVMFVLADCYNPDYHYAWPSIQSVASAALLCERHVRRILGLLETKGLLEISKSRGGLGHTNCYRFPGFSPDVTISKSDRATGLSHSKAGPGIHQTRTSESRKSDVAVSGEPVETATATGKSGSDASLYKLELADMKRQGPIGDFSRRLWRERLRDPAETASIPEWFRREAAALVEG
jgi:hypothetical protein